jgi:hypothetical protein
MYKIKLNTCHKSQNIHKNHMINGTLVDNILALYWIVQNIWNTYQMKYLLKAYRLKNSLDLNRLK